MHSSIKSGFSWKTLVIIITAVFLILYPIVFGHPYVTFLLFLFFIWAIVASSWDLIIGYAGVFNLGHVAFFVIGGFSSGILAKYLGIIPILCPVLGGIITTIIVILFVALPALRLPDVYIALYSIMFHITIPSLLTQTRKWSGGSKGLRGIPPLLENIEMIHYYYIALGLLSISLFIIYKVLNSSTGQAFVALRDSRDFARSLGINEYKEKVKVFGVSAFLASVAGGVYAHYMESMTPTSLGITRFLLALTMVYIGGRGRFPGAVLGAALIVFADEFFRAVGMWRHVVLGSLIIFVVLFFPKGLIQIVDYLDLLINKMVRKQAPVRKGVMLGKG